jgi:neuronal calcium sensor
MTVGKEFEFFFFALFFSIKKKNCFRHFLKRAMGNKQGKGDKKQDPFTVDPQTLRDVQEKYGLDKVKVDQFFETFRDAAGQNGELDKKTFEASLKKLEAMGLRLADTPFADRLFELLDKDNSGTIDVSEFLSGMAVVVRGSTEEKLWLTFRAYDLDGDGYISQSELVTLFKQAWLNGLNTLMASEEMQGDETTDEAERDIDEFSTELAEKFAKQAFLRLDKNQDGKLSFDEFKEFAAQDPKITTTLNGFQKETRITLMAVQDGEKPAAD